MRSTPTFTKLSRILAAAAVLSLGAPAAWADETSAFCGLLRLTPDQAADKEARPLPARHQATARKDWGAFQVKNMLTNETFNMPVFPHYPVSPGVQPALLATLENDGNNVIAPVDLTGRGVSDLLLGRKDWGGWRVYTNGQALSKPFDGFVEGFYPKPAEGAVETLQNQLLPMDLSDLEVDRNLMTAAGDFLGNGTEQLAYTRPGANQVWVVGQHGVMTMKADLQGIAPASGSARSHWLFPYKSNRKGQRTRLAYYRLGADHLRRLVPRGMEFVQEKVPLKGHWERLNQAVLDWPQAAPPNPGEAAGR